MPFKFEKLEVCNDAVKLSGLVHAVCLSFPKDDFYILTPQLKRATDSISLNIAEGSTGQSNPEFKKFLGYCHPFWNRGYRLHLPGEKKEYYFRGEF